MNARKAVAALALTAALLVPGAALAAHGKAGLWNVESTMTVAGSNIPSDANARMRRMGQKPPGEQSYVLQSCVTQAQVDADKPPRIAQQSSGCAWQNTKFAGNSMSADLVCKGGMRGSGKMQITYSSPEHYSGLYTFLGTTDGNVTDMRMTIKGDWLQRGCGLVKPVK